MKKSLKVKHTSLLRVFDIYPIKIGLNKVTLEILFLFKLKLKKGRGLAVIIRFYFKNY